MAVTVSSFLERHPGFSSAPTELVQRVIDDTAPFVSDSWPAEQIDIYHEYLVADALARDPHGRNAAQDKNGDTIYSKKIKEMKRMHSLVRRTSL